MPRLSDRSCNLTPLMRTCEPQKQGWRHSLLFVASRYAPLSSLGSNSPAKACSPIAVTPSPIGKLSLPL